MSGYSRAQITRLISQYLKAGCVQITQYQRHSFTTKYQDSDLKLLAHTDELHEFPNGNMIKTILTRLAKLNPQYQNIMQVSVSHIYNLRKKPEIEQSPLAVLGFIRIDSVHQGDRLKLKGVYHINDIDEITQIEFIGAVEQITEEFMLPLLLNKLLIKLTKSRPRHSNDNALVESKNGTIIRKWFGYGFIHCSHAKKINDFYFGSFNHYLNFHRPCAFAKNLFDDKGKIRKIQITAALSSISQRRIVIHATR